MKKPLLNTILSRVIILIISGIFSSAAFAQSTTPQVMSLLSLHNFGSNTLVDGAMAIYNCNYSNAVDYDDAMKMPNGSENVSYKRDGVLLAVERRNLITQNDTLFLNITGERIHQYQFDIVMQNMDNAGRTAFFVDKFLNTSVPLNMTGHNLQIFSVDSDPATHMPDRFMIVFLQTTNQPIILPVTFTSVTATPNIDKTNTIRWKTDNELNLDKYVVERSSDGISFHGIGSDFPTNNAGGTGVYNFIDMNPANGNNFYRIEAIDLDNQVGYSNLVSVNGALFESSLSIYPNPIQGGNVNLQFGNQPAGTYMISVINMSGRTVYTETVQATSDHFVHRLSLGGRIARGSYYARITSQTGKTTSLPFIIN